jgi:hypothetical protein
MVGAIIGFDLGLIKSLNEPEKKNDDAHELQQKI